MEDEDESYGFGSFVDLFDGAPGSTAPPKALDVDATRRYWMPERLLAQLQQRRDDDGGSDSDPGVDAKEFRHVGARLDGRAVDGGMGRVRFVHPRDAAGGGVMWLQAARSDSNAQARRRALLAADERSPAALFVPLGDVTGVRATTIQNTVQGVELALAGGHALHLAFLPGPFFNARHRDEFLAAIHQRLQVLTRAREARDEEKAAPAPKEGAAEAVQAVEAQEEAEPSRFGADAAGNEETADRDAMRALVRRYARLNESSDEAIRLARQVHEATGYHVGPLAKTLPRFSEDATYRKVAVQKLSKCLTTMNQEWTQADAERELHTNTRAVRDQDELFQYTDAATGEDVSPRSYEWRYAQYARLEDSDPVIRCFPQGGAPKDGVCESFKAGLAALLGVDVSTSCVIDESFFKDDATEGGSKLGLEAAPLSEATSARQLLWQRWEVAFSEYMKQREAAPASEDGASANANTPVGATREDRPAQPSSPGARKRPRDWRRSIVPPCEAAALNGLLASPLWLPGGSGDAESEPRRAHGKRRRRSSSPSPELRAARHDQVRRKARRQSISASVDPVLLAGSASEDGEGASTPLGAPAVRGKPSPPKRQVNGEDGSREGEAEVLCQLCFSETADVEMDPCGHRVCGTCWDRLTPGGGAVESQGEHMCPWDRELVSRR